MHKRTSLLVLFCVLLIVAGCRSGNAIQIRFDQVKEYPVVRRDKETLRIGVVTMRSPRESFEGFRDLADYLGDQVGGPADLVLRKSYAELNELVRTAAVDIALVGFGGYAAGRRQFGMEGIVTGQIDGITDGDALLLVRADSGGAQLNDLRERAIAFTDPLSYSGHLVLRDWMARQGLTPEQFFSKTLFTFSQDGAVEAVIGRVVDAALVDAYQYRAYLSRHPQLDGKLRVLLRLKTPGSMVIVVRPDLPDQQKAQFRTLLLDMSESAEGRRILAGLQLERFVPVSAEGGAP